MKRWMYFLIFTLFSLTFLFQSQEANVYKVPDLHSLLYDLGYNDEDILVLSDRLSQQEIEHAIELSLTKAQLFPYLNHPYFNIKRYYDYEMTRESHGFSHFVSVNYTHQPIIQEFSFETTETTDPSLFKGSSLVLVNKQFYLSPHEMPQNLVLIRHLNLVIPGDLERNYMGEEALDALRSLFLKAEEQGHTLFVSSAYRSYQRQEVIYHNLLMADYRNAMLSAKPGHSEHHTGLSVDITSRSVGYDLVEAFAYTPEGKFIAENAHHYGFIIRYPKDKEKGTGYLYEPWHLRYVGKEIAKEIYENHLTLEEFILYHEPIPEIEQVN